jgi:hypothetical protein
MTIQTFGGGFYWPEPNTSYYVPINNALASLALDGAGKKAAAVFQAPATGTLEKVYVLIAGYASTGNLDFRLETVDASTGHPTGTLVTGTTANAAVSITANGVFSATLNVEVVKGTVYALVWARSAGSYSVRCSGAFQHRFGVATAYVRYDSGAGYGTISSVYEKSPNFGIKIEGAYYPVPGAIATSALANTTFNNTSTTRERGSAFVLPFTARVNGFFAMGTFGSANADFVLANTAGTALATYAFDKDSVTTSYAASTGYPHMIQGTFSATVDIAAGTTYYLTAKPTSGTDIALYETDIIDTSDTATMNCLNGGTNLKLVTRDSGGAYTVSTTKRPFSMGLIVSGFDDAAGGGSTVYVGGVTF